MSKEESILFITLAALGFLLCRIPYAGRFFRIFNTLFHEGGHALAGWITGSEVMRIDLLSDTSGTTITKSSNTGAQILISLAGYVFASLIPYVFIIVLSEGYDIALHILFVALSAVLLMLAVRNTFGIIWIIVMLSGYLLVILKAPDYAWIVTYAYTGILLFEGLFSAITLFWLSVTRSADAGDATNMQRFTHLPVWFWGFVFMAQACLFFYLAVIMLF